MPKQNESRSPLKESGSLHPKLSLGRSANGAGARARTAGNAGIGVDHVVLITLGDGGHGAGALASATADALVTNHICQWKHLQYRMYQYCTTRFLKCNAKFSLRWVYFFETVKNISN